MLFLSLDCSQKDSGLAVFLTKVKRVFHVSILSLVVLVNCYASGRLSYRQASTYRPCYTYCVTVLVFVCPYVCTTLSHPCRTVLFCRDCNRMDWRDCNRMDWSDHSIGPFVHDLMIGFNYVIFHIQIRITNFPMMMWWVMFCEIIPHFWLPGFQ